MSNEFDDIGKIFDGAEPTLTSSDSDAIRRGVWHRVRRHKIIVKVRIAVTTVAVIVIAIVATLPKNHAQNYDYAEMSYLSSNELIEEISQIPVDEITVQLADNDESEIQEAILSEVDLEDAVKTLSKNEQEELLIAMSDM